jgi:hypothetical protein
MKELHGYDATTIKDLIQGVGNGYFNWNLADLRDPTEADPVGSAKSAALKIGATRGGLNISIKPNYQSINLDGVRESTKNSKRLVDYTARVSFSLAQHNVANLRKILDRSRSVAYASPNGLTEITEDMTTNCGWPDYIANIGFEILYGDCNNTVPAIIIIKNVLNDAGITITTADKEVGVSQVDFMGHYDPATPTESVFSIFIKPSV